MRGARGARRAKAYAPMIEADGNAGRTALVRTFDRAGLEVDHPVMQRASDGAAVDNPFRERSTFMRATIVEREDTVIGGAENGDIAIGGAYDPCAHRRNVFQCADIDPVD